MNEKIRVDQIKAAAGPGQKAGGTAIGEALRSIYQTTVEEEIPDEFLDLLGKLT